MGGWGRGGERGDSGVLKRGQFFKVFKNTLFPSMFEKYLFRDI